MKKMRLLLLLILLTSCTFTSQKSSESAQKTEESEVEKIGEVQPESQRLDLLAESDEIVNYNELAKKLAGLSVDQNFLKDPVYLRYKKTFDAFWAKLSRESFSLISAWVVQNIHPLAREVDTIFYPFGGPDVTYVINFFPNASRYILVGLDGTGSFDKINERMQDTQAIPHLEATIHTYIRGGYFITVEMLKHLSSRALSGTLHLILLQLARLNFKILKIENISIDKSGREVPACANSAKSIKIVCEKIDSKTNQKSQKTFYYVSLDLSNTNPKVSWLEKFVNTNPFCTFIKSASYALHDPGLFNIKNFILKNTQFVLQDDTGIPFRNFNKSWKKHAFGAYTNPTLAVFKAYKQSDLEEFFANADSVKIPFKIGYGYNLCRPNLILAVPKVSRMPADIAVISDINAVKKIITPEAFCDSCGENNKDDIILKVLENSAIAYNGFFQT